MTAGLASAPYDGVLVIQPEHLLQELRSERAVTVVDVRDPEQIRAHGCIEQARTIPLHQLAARAEELCCHRNELVVVVSGRGIRSRVAAELLRTAGFEDVRSLEGGMTQWLALELPVEESRRSLPPP